MLTGSDVQVMQFSARGSHLRGDSINAVSERIKWR